MRWLQCCVAQLRLAGSPIRSYFPGKVNGVEPPNVETTMNKTHATLDPQELDALMGHARNQRGAAMVAHFRQLLAALRSLFQKH